MTTKTLPQTQTIDAPLLLSYTEICTITGRTRFTAQARALAKMRINYVIRPDGLPIVSRNHFEAIMGAIGNVSSPTAVEPDWSKLDAA